ncbi:ExbD/TolR family protein [Pseudomonas sp. KNUC1026]|uniref:ExbD/TolR family protein n=1 Tax=Pseudomonas sp. KNUC1026 TaxID=2893890 RepID=UPI001F4834D2|nr:biopolymer transporter ExbD [Pseudomonas sp. KNUC1026]UFH50217.1 biopolymer transporter ExbD [Pseudomonas sp. KNUC1026]
MKFRRRRQREHIDINLASLIDIVFVLLLFFVVTTTFTRETQLRVELPQAVSGAPSELDEKRIDIAISADGEYAVNDKRLPKSDLDTLMSAIKSEAGENTALPMSISADGKTPHQAVITAMDAAGKLGFSKLSMTTIEAQGH